MTIAGLALTAGSTVANYSAQAQIEAARNDALAAERIRQNGLNQEADALNLTSRDRYKEFGADQTERGLALASEPIIIVIEPLPYTHPYILFAVGVWCRLQHRPKPTFLLIQVTVRWLKD